MGRTARRMLSTAPALLAVGALIGLATASGPYFASSAGSAALEGELGGAGEHRHVLTVRIAADAPPTAIRRADDAVRDAVSEVGLPPPTLEVVARFLMAGVDVPDRSRGDDESADVVLGRPAYEVTLVGREGAARYLPEVVEPGDGALAVPAWSAAELDLTADDTALRLSGSRGEIVVARGPIVGDPGVEPFWQPVSGWVSAPAADGHLSIRPPTLLGEPDEVLDVIAAVERSGVPVTEGRDPALLTVTWSVAVDAGTLTIDRARALVDDLEPLRAAAVDPTTGLGRAIQDAGSGRRWSTPPLVGGQLDGAVARAEAALAALATPVRMLAATGQLVGLALLTVLVAAAGSRAGPVFSLAAAQGRSPVLIGVRWASGAAAALVAGMVAGWQLAAPLVARLGPSAAVDPAASAEVARSLAIVGALALLVIGAATGMRAARADGIEQRRSWDAVAVAEILVVVLAALAFWEAQRRGALPVGAEASLAANGVALLVPLLVAVATTVIGARLVRWALRWSARGTGGPTWWHVASRRLRSMRGVTTAAVLVTSTAVSVVVVTSSLARSVDATVDEKALLAVGAVASVDLAPSEVADHTTAQLVTAPSTRVVRVEGASLDARRDIDLLIVDASTFAAVAHQPSALDVPLSGLVGALEHDRAGGRVPVLAVGTTVRAGDGLHAYGVDLPLLQVERLEAFPGVVAGHPTLVLADDGTFTDEDPALARRMHGARTHQLWIDGAESDVAAQTVAFGRPERTTLAAQLRDTPAASTARWTFTYLGGQAAAIALLGSFGLFAVHVSRHRAQALGTALARRMGLRARDRVAADLLELGALVASATSIGVMGGVVAAVAVLDHYDPIPEIVAPTVTVLSWGAVPWLVGVGGVAVAVTAVVTIVVVDRADAARLLRGDA